MTITLIDAWTILLQETVDGIILTMPERVQAHKRTRDSNIRYILLAKSPVVYDLHSAEYSSKFLTYLGATKD